MARRTFYDMLKGANVNIAAEYQTLFRLLYEPIEAINSIYSLYELIDAEFVNLPIRGTCLDLDDFDERYGYHFDESPGGNPIDNLLLIMEYIFNLTYQAQDLINGSGWTKSNACIFIAEHLSEVCEKINHKFIEKDSFFILVEDNPIVLEATQVLSDERVYLPLQYTHHSLAGDLDGKREILSSLGHELESKRNELKAIDKKLEDSIFFCLNNLNIRHNNSDTSSPHYKEAVVKMSSDELERWYDYTYRMILVALTKLGDYPNQESVDELKSVIGKG